MQGRSKFAAAALFAACLLICARHGEAFITIQGGEFVDEDCSPFHFNGYNTWQILENAAGVVGSQADVGAQFDQAVDNGFNVVRIFGFGTQGGFALQSSQGVYNQQAWDALDYVINEAKRRQLRLVVALADNWDTDSNTDNRRAYVSYSSGAGGDIDSFYTDSAAQSAFQAHVETVVNHVNSLTQLAYKNEPTILSWNLINEPRCDNSPCATEMQAWISTQAEYLKSVDSNHLVTVGEDGFYDFRQCNADVNPAGWAGQTGQNFLPNHALQSIDYASIHLWPDNWGQSDIDFARYWVTNHSSNAVTLKKPLVIEEFGKTVNASVPDRNEFQRYQFYKLVYSQVEDSIEDGDVLKGIMFWRWDAVRAVDLTTTGSPGTNADTIASNSDIFTDIIQPFSRRVGAIKSSTVQGCTPTTAGASEASSPTGGGTVSTASVEEDTGPGPDDFATPDPASIGGGCNALAGRLLGDLVGEPQQAANAQACCAACRNNRECTVWNYCFCDGGCAGNTVDRGTCELRNQPNAFYPRADINGGGGFIAGVPKESNITFPWECQPEGSGCTPQTVDSCPAAGLRSSLVCPSGSCNASQANVGGDVITIDVNADAGSTPVRSAADCCTACQQRSGCNVWTFCPLVDGCDDGCEDYVATAQTGTANPPFGPNGGCQGDAFPFNACTLKNQAGGFTAAQVYDSGSRQPWVSGTVA